MLATPAFMVSASGPVMARNPVRGFVVVWMPSAGSVSSVEVPAWIGDDDVERSTTLSC